MCGRTVRFPRSAVNGPGWQVDLPTTEDTMRLGRAVAAVVRPGDLVVLAGPLGTGKTVLTQGIGAGLAVQGRVTSPTFVIARTHPGGRVPLVHVDAYRLGSVSEVDDLDLDSDLADAVTVVEWGSGLFEHLSDSFLTVRMHRHTDGETRTAVLVPTGESWVERVRQLRSGWVLP